MRLQMGGRIPPTGCSARKAPSRQGPNHACHDTIKLARHQEEFTKGQWKFTRRQFLDEDSLREYRVLKVLCQIPSKLLDYPRVSELHPSGRAFWVKSPRLYWVPLLLRVKTHDLDIDSLLGLQRALEDLVKLVYKKGVAYKVRPEYLYPVRKEHGHWKLYLGGWMEATFAPNESQAQPKEWKRREEAQISEIKRIFAEAYAMIHAKMQ